MKKTIGYGLLCASVLSFLLVAASVVLMAFGGSEETGAKIRLICGICFWVFLLLGILFQVVLSLYVRRWAQKERKMLKQQKNSPKLGLISFFRNLPGKASDLLFPIALIVLVIFYILTKGTSIVCFITLALMIFTFCTHCIFNGKNYYYITNQEKIEESYRKKTEESK